jgi:hypothetical protein
MLQHGQSIIKRLINRRFSDDSDNTTHVKSPSK